VATNLLLEGDDLEALLIKAHAEGGPTARIVRADKFRHGGVWGFFARERFEVAVEIPALGRSAVEEGPPEARGDSVRPGARPVARGGAAFFLPEADEAPIGPPPPRRPRAGSAAPGADRPPVDVLLNMADGASASKARHLDLPAVEAEQSREAELVGAGRTGSPAPRADASASDPGSSGSSGGPAPISSLPAAGRPEFDALITALSGQDRAGIPSRPLPPAVRAAYLDDETDDVSEAGDGGDAEDGDGTGGDGCRPTARIPTPRGPMTEFPLPDLLTPELLTLDLSTPDPSTPDLSTPELPVLPDLSTPGFPIPPEPVTFTAPPACLVEQDPRHPHPDADRHALIALGVPEPWVAGYGRGDRFGEVLRALEPLPEPDIDMETTVVAVVGPVGTATMEAYRTALDLAMDYRPRPVVVVPADSGPAREALLEKARYGGPVVVAVETDGCDAGPVRDALAALGAGAVLTVVDATVPLERTSQWLEALGTVDALVVDGSYAVPDPATAMRLGPPVIRLDGIPIDRVTWTALLCARLIAAERSAVAGH
jgi:hypothetical protein